MAPAVLGCVLEESGVLLVLLDVVLIDVFILEKLGLGYIELIYTALENGVLVVEVEVEVLNAVVDVVEVVVLVDEVLATTVVDAACMTGEVIVVVERGSVP